MSICMEKMKNTRMLYLLMLILMPTHSIYAANFQIKQKININKNVFKKQAIAKTNIPNIIKMPDLTINRLNLSTMHSGKFSGKIYVKNIGKTSVSKSFYFSIEQLDNFNRWQKIHQACFKININRPLKPNQTISSRFTLNYNPGDRNVKIRAYVDSACMNETPYIWGNIKELNEKNNHSTIKTISGYYNPHITSLHPYFPNLAIINKDTLYITGYKFGAKQGTHKVFLKNQTTLHIYNTSIVRWSDSAIYFKVPQSVGSGIYNICIDSNCITTQKVLLSKESFCSWNNFLDKIETFYTLIGDIHIETKKNGTKCTYQNNSTENVIGANTQLKTQPLNVQKIQFHIKALGDYRYNIQDLNADTHHITVVKYFGSQFVINIPFESNGIEAKGCFKSIAGGGWHDNLAPDIHINNLKLKIAIKLTHNNGSLSYKAATSVSANIKAAKKINTAVLNLFVKHWRNRVKKGIISSMNNALNNDQDTRNSIINSFMTIFHTYSTPNIPLGTQLKNIRFERNGIYLVY